MSTLRNKSTAITLALAALVWAAPQTASAVGLPYYTIGRCFTTSGSMVLNDGNYAQFWVYPKDARTWDHVNSIYNRTALGAFVEVGYDWQWWMISQPQVFVHYQDAAGNYYEQFLPSYYLSPGTNAKFKLQRIAGSPYSWRALLNENVIWDFGNVGISSSYADAGAEAALASENNLASWTYISYRKWVSNSGTGSWYYWPHAYEQWDRVSRSPRYRLNTSGLGSYNHRLFTQPVN